MFVLFVTTLLLSTVTAKSWTWEAPIGSIQGTYDTVGAKMKDHPASLASLWEIGQSDFDIVVWPPKYCAAVHVYFINQTYKGIGKFHVVEEMMKSPSVKYYMPTGRIDLDPSGKSPKSYFNQRSSIPFNHQDKLQYSVSVTEKHVDKIRDYNSATKGGAMTNVVFNLDGRVALILTNSRFCFAHITKDGMNGEYVQILDPNTMTNEKVEVLTTYDKYQGIPSLFNPIAHVMNAAGDALKHPKTVDLLPMLRNPEFHDNSKIRAPNACNGFVTTSRNRLKKSIDQVSADSWSVQELQVKSQPRDEHFIVAIGRECSWIRLWITDSANDMKSYEAQFKQTKTLSDTIDIFFDQQFFVGPDSNEAHPLSGNSSQIGKISIRRHWNQAGTKTGLAQMSYGRDGGPSLPYIEYFYLPKMSQQNFRVNLIKAPKCEANLITAPETQLSSANQPPTNVFEFPGCQKYYLKNKNKDDVAEQ